MTVTLDSPELCWYPRFALRRNSSFGVGLIPRRSMESDPPQTILYLHKETRVDLQPAHPKSTVHFQLPSTSAFTLTSQIQRKILSSLPSSKTEEAFRKQNVASCGSLYFRPTTKYPRGILWRCLEDNTVLELRSVDLSKSEDENQEAFLVLRFGFPSPIRPEGVALADPSDQDVFNLFVLTKSNDLYTLTLRSGLFCRIEASEGDFSRWCKVFKPSLLTISTPHRLTASSSLELLVALSDGRLMRLVRKAGSDGSNWEEAAYSDGQWTSSLRGLIRWQGSNTVKYDGNLLDQNTAVAAVTSPDRKHIFAICLNHTLRAWNIKSGKLTFSRDLLDIDRDPRETARVMLDPSISQTLTIFELSGGPQGDFYYIATYSPHSSGVFKFWAVRDADHSASGVRALFPDVIFRVPDPDDGALWTMADFRLAVSPGTTELEIWVLMKLNRRYKLYHRQADLNDMDSDWNYGWSITAADPPNFQQSHQPPLTFSNLDAEDVSDWWLDFIFYPGRIPNTILETALTIYDHDQDGNIATFKNRKTSLKNRLPKIIGTKVLLQRSDSAEEDYNNFREKLNDQWMAFWTIASELDQARLEPLSLGFDVDARMPWIVFGDACSAVRQCCQTELLIHNKPMDLVRHNNLLLKESIEEADSSSISSLPEELALMIESAARFRASFSNALRVSCKNVIKTELWQDPSYSILVRIQSFYDKCDFAGQVGDRQYNDLSASLKDLGAFDGLSTSLFESILATLPQSMSNEASGLVSTKFGLKVLVKGAQDMIELHTRLITDLLLLIVFVDMEVDRDECAMESLDTTRVYMGLVNRLKQYQIMQWLATHIRPDPARDTENSEKDTNEAGNTRLAEGPRTLSTVLENLFATDPKPQSYAHQPQSITLTSNIRDLLKWVTGGTDSSITLDQVLVHIQCNLLRDNNIELASSFLQFQPSTAWATYVRGRLCILEGEHSEAATYFQKAAYRLCKLFRPCASSNRFADNMALFSSPRPSLQLCECLRRSSLLFRRLVSYVRSSQLLHSHPISLRASLRPYPNPAFLSSSTPIHTPNTLIRGSLVGTLLPP